MNRRQALLGGLVLAVTAGLRDVFPAAKQPKPKVDRDQPKPELVYYQVAWFDSDNGKLQRIGPVKTVLRSELELPPPVGGWSLNNITVTEA